MAKWFKSDWLLILKGIIKEVIVRESLTLRGGYFNKINKNNL
jgi:hypothetical protein